MGTKAIESVLKWAKEEHADVERAADDALAELEAIRKAAKVLTYPISSGLSSQDHSDAKRLLESIAKEEP